VALFPQLVAGPIVRYHQIADQLTGREHTLERFCRGAALFVFGLAKKVLLANPMGALATSAFAAEAPGALGAWFGALAFAFQIYFDFSGYSDMAVGLGRMLGFELPRNFDAPYRAESITDFWRRWHISLSAFLRDYLYIPLGGNRKGPARTLINLALVMLLGGLWHGAAWHFLLWGAFHGALLMGERLAGKRSFVWFAPRPVRTLVTFALVCVGWVLFKADSLGAAGAYLGSMFGLVGAGPGAGLLTAELICLNGLVLMGLCALLSLQPVQAWDLAERLSWPRVAALAGLFWLTACGMFAQSFQPFLYYRF
jgi:alginate O-acetyltransferase complex protein AlgI